MAERWEGRNLGKIVHPPSPFFFPLPPNLSDDDGEGGGVAERGGGKGKTPKVPQYFVVGFGSQIDTRALRDPMRKAPEGVSARMKNFETAFKSISGASLLYFDPDEWETGKGNGAPCICCEKFNKALVQIPNRQRGPTKGTTLILPRKIVYTAGSFGGLSVGNLTSTAYFTSRDPKSNLVRPSSSPPKKGSSYT